MMVAATDLNPEPEQLVIATEQGIPLGDHLPSLLANAVQQEDWAEDDASQATVMGSISTMRRIWDTPEEDEAWKHLEDL